MIRKASVFTVVFLLCAGLVSSAFYVMEDGERKKVAPAEQAQENAAAQSPVSSSGNAVSQDGSTEVNSSNFVSVMGDTLEGSLDMSGFGLTGLPVPDDPSDAATKKYVDDNRFSNVSLEGYATEEFVLDQIDNSSVDLSNYATEGFVLDLVGNSSDSSVDLSGYATEEYVDEKVSDVSADTGPNSSDSGSGKSSTLDNVSVSDGVFRIGSNRSEMDLSVSGDLSVGGGIEGVNLSEDQTVYSYSFATDPNGTEVNLPSEIGQSYTVTATSVNSLADTGVFNKTSEGFSVVSSEFTKVDVQVAENSE